MKLIFEWDASKARINLAKHQVSFEEAKTLLNDPLMLTVIDESHSKDEGRFISIGRSVRGRILLLIHTESHETEDSLVIRIISCRKATKSERKTYEEGQK
jgi:uncharacterized DUF497 family protein